ncbi:MAG: hypothetical protein NVS3B9_6500 [Candidatus Doudnabacteria bacterium]
MSALLSIILVTTYILTNYFCAIKTKQKTAQRRFFQMRNDRNATSYHNKGNLVFKERLEVDHCPDRETSSQNP